MSDFLKEKPSRAKYIEVQAISSLPSHHYLYEAQIDLTCAECGVTIPVNSYFGRKVVKPRKEFLPCCRQCRPFQIFTDLSKRNRAPCDEEYLYVSEGEVSA